MSKVNVDEIKVGDLVEMTYSDGVTCLGLITRTTDSFIEGLWSDNNGRHTQREGISLAKKNNTITGHWKVINFEEESKVDELKVYTGKETLQALLEGKTLEYNGTLYRFTDKLQVDFKTGCGWESSMSITNNMLGYKMTEVVPLK
ncbi:hypothetical protein [Bacillus toyonensis]|uniref:hypothetical protein n=1 Tax=Bacillus toyonensis TaxID=155322 RepID=UPI00124F6F52|nr:hypothetical protein [Bacillus toyonensis]KAB2380230.1 hypothetical protein F8507_27495 [Bacillus toyonensis]